MKENQAHQDLASIRSLMERSSKFISLSGLSGVLAGIYALMGAFFAYRIIYSDSGFFNSREYPAANIAADLYHLIVLVTIATIVLLASVLTALILSAQKAKKTGQPFWGQTSRALLFNMIVPLLTGGVLIGIFISRGYFGIVAPASLIFYGLALIGAGNFTFTDVKYLGISQIILGLIAALYPGYGLLFWAIGFGVLHIIYGSIMYLKYDR